MGYDWGSRHGSEVPAIDHPCRTARGVPGRFAVGAALQAGGKEQDLGVHPHNDGGVGPQDLLVEGRAGRDGHMDWSEVQASGSRHIRPFGQLGQERHDWRK